MKFSHLEQIVTHMEGVRKINAIYRVADTIVKMVFNDEKTYYFDMKKSNSQIFISLIFLSHHFLHLIGRL